MSEIVVRPARRDDSTDIARLFLISSDGLAAYIWSKSDAPGRSLIEIGAARYAREGVAFSYQNCLVAEQDGRVVGMVHSFPMLDPRRPGDIETDPVLRPYSELEDYGSLYISGVACRPEAHGRGVGTRLLGECELRARRLGLRRLSLICFERNEGATRLYRRLGYVESARRPLVPHPALRYADGDAVLLIKTLA